MREAYISRSNIVVSGLICFNYCLFFFFFRSISKCFLLIFCKRNRVCDGGLIRWNKSCFQIKNVCLQSVSHSTAENHTSLQEHIELCRIAFLLHVAEPSDPSRTHLAMRGGLAGPERLIKSMRESHHCVYNVKL